jgi:hypothetical protein
MEVKYVRQFNRAKNVANENQPHTCKHIAKATRANAATKALSKSLQVPAQEKKNKKFPYASQKLNLPSHKPINEL